MTVTEIVAYIGGGSILAVILGLIKIKPLEISVWSWLFRKIGKAFNGETLDYVKALQTSFNEHLSEHEKDKAEKSRQRILEFADEMYDRKYHSKESFEDILDVIEGYDKYCEKHPDFKNKRTVTASKVINEQYEECLKNHTFKEM